MILLQPDLGTTLLLLFSALTVMFLAGLPLRLFIGGGLAVATMVPIVYTFFMMPHKQTRWQNFLNPEDDPMGAGSHITQSKNAIGPGGLYRKGYINDHTNHPH